MLPGRLVFALLIATSPISTLALSAQQGPTAAERASVRAIEQMLLRSDEASLQEFVSTRLSRAYASSMSRAELNQHLRTLRGAVGGRIDDVVLERDAMGYRLRIAGAKELALQFDLDQDGRITRLEPLLAPGTQDSARPTAAEMRPPSRPSTSSSAWSGLTWETLGTRFESSPGFRGVVVAQRDGASLLRRGYGFTGDDRAHPAELNTVYDIGSTPIEFTISAVHMLHERGRLALTDSIGKYFPDVPADKRGMTLEHLLTGRSGLPDFHHDDAVDWDQDLAWIDRETAVRRILRTTLLFAPGTSQEHSHSAFGLLAAVVELASGRTFRDFVRQEILQPLGMTRSGFYGEDLGLPVAAFAHGAGPSRVGLPNIPPNWGPASWLVMGSGGMMSSAEDLERYYAGKSAGRLYRVDSAALARPSLALGGTDRGFFVTRVSNGKGSSVLILTNADEGPQSRGELLGALQALVIGNLAR